MRAEHGLVSRGVGIPLFNGAKAHQTAQVVALQGLHFDIGSLGDVDAFVGDIFDAFEGDGVVQHIAEGAAEAGGHAAKKNSPQLIEPAFMELS